MLRKTPFAVGAESLLDELSFATPLAIQVRHQINYKEVQPLNLGSGGVC